MRARKFVAILACSGLSLWSAQVAVAQQDDSASAAELRAELEQLKLDYEQRLARLEARLAAMESAPAAPAPATGGSALSDKAFNPAISLILDGKYGHFSNAEGLRDLPGFQLGGESGSFNNGLILGESELNLQANVDDKFFAAATIAFESDGDESGAAVEEAYLQTLALPDGFAIKAGRFYSGIGYLNGIHSHGTGFADDPLPYRAFFNGRLADTGIQASWTAPTLLYAQFGVEALSGNSFPAAGAANSGVGTRTAFAKFGGDFNVSNSWLASLSYVDSNVSQRSSGGTAEESGIDPLFGGDSSSWIASLVWKWAPYGNPRDRNFRFTAEYLDRQEDGVLDLDGVTGTYSGDQSGYYLEGVYRFHPQWSAGLRYDTLDADNRVFGLGTPTVLDDNRETPKRLSAMVDFWNSEFSILRLQYNHDDSSLNRDRQWVLQYIMSMGAHGGHSF